MFTENEINSIIFDEQISKLERLKLQVLKLFEISINLRLDRFI